MKYIDMLDDDAIENMYSKERCYKYHNIAEFIQTEERAKKLDELKVKNWYVLLFTAYDVQEIAFSQKRIPDEDVRKFFDYTIDNKMDFRGKEVFLWKLKQYESFGVTGAIYIFKQKFIFALPKEEKEKIKKKADEKRKKWKEHINKHGSYFNFNFNGFLGGLKQSTNYYKVLKVEFNATDNEVKKAYRNLAKVHHPDMGGDANKFREINEAYEKIKVLRRIK